MPVIISRGGGMTEDSGQVLGMRLQGGDAPFQRFPGDVDAMAESVTAASQGKITGPWAAPGRRSAASGLPA
jgi:hypothetical protein